MVVPRIPAPIMATSNCFNENSEINSVLIAYVDSQEKRKKEEIFWY